jgi:hypothetical protein
LCCSCGNLDLMKHPEKGFYYHYKHDPQAEFNHYAYEVLGVARDSETSEMSVLYRPLYDNDHLAPADHYVRPIDMFMGEVRVGEMTLPRFKQIFDPSLIGQLKEVRDRIYKIYN